MPTKGCKAYIRKKINYLINYSGGHPDPEVRGGRGGGGEAQRKKIIRPFGL